MAADDTGSYLRSVLPLSVLDLSPIVAGSNATQALRNTIDLARRADALGFTRYWLAEHHNTPSIASSSPEIVIAQVASATTSLRVGSGGVMLPNHSALKVAESFRVLEALHPGRIDLGIGRAPGTDRLAALALRRSSSALNVDEFPEQLRDLLGFLHDDLPPEHPFGRVVAAPVGVAPPELWMLGSSDYGGAVAAQLGCGFAFAHHINPEPAVETMLAYRTQFQPSRHRARPHAILGLSVTCAETDDEAERLAASQDVAWVHLAMGRPVPLPRVEDALAYPWTAAEELERRSIRRRRVIGGPARVRATIERLVEATAADEVIVTTMVHDHIARVRSYELLAESFALAASRTTGSG
jgi:luciferase family oxidoreductase group 1